MGNTVSFSQCGSEERTLRDFIPSLSSLSPLSDTPPHNLVLLWQISCSDESSIVTDYAVDIRKWSDYDITSSYVALHIFSCLFSSEEKTNQKKVSGSLSSALRPAVEALSPRGLKVPISFRTRSIQEVTHDLYVWNGKKAPSLVKATAIAKAYQLERALRTTDMKVVLSSIPHLPSDSVPLYENVSEDVNGRSSLNHHFLKTLMTFNQTGTFVVNDNDFSDLFEAKRGVSMKDQTNKNIEPKERPKKRKKKDGAKKTDKANDKSKGFSLTISPPKRQETKRSPAPKGVALKLQMDKVEREAITDRKPGQDQRNLVAANTIECQHIVETGTERVEEIPVSTRDRVRYYNRICSRVTDQLYLGSDWVAQNFDLLTENKITHIFNCAGTVCNNYFPEQFQYKTLHLLDGKQEDAMCVFLDAIEFFHDALEKDGRVFIHCQQGISRSSTMLICYLILEWHQPTSQVHEIVKQMREISCPNAGFMCQLMNWDKIVSKVPDQRPPELAVLLPHNLCAPDIFPLKKVELKMKSLDPRCAFVLTSPNALYLWIGSQKPHPETINVAKKYIVREQTYLGASKNVVEILQGQEPKEFWTFFKDYSDPPKIEINDQYNTRTSLLPLYEAKSLPLPEKREEKKEKPQLFIFRSEWVLFPSPTAKEIESLKQKDLIFAFLVSPPIVPRPHAYLWLGSSFDRIDDKEVTNLGLQFLTRNNIFMNVTDYKILISRQGNEVSDFASIAQSILG